MRRVLAWAGLVALLASCSTLQSVFEADPFKELTTYVEEHKGWIFNHAQQAELFAKTRTRLGARFGEALLKYVDGKPDRAYWCGYFLITDTYLLGQKSDPVLAAAVFERGTAVKVSFDSKELKDQRLAASYLEDLVLAATLDWQLGDKDKARSLKAEAEALMKKYPAYSAAFPPLDKEQLKTYRAIK